jgi:hypothetical protein
MTEGHAVQRPMLGPRQVHGFEFEGLGFEGRPTSNS